MIISQTKMGSHTLTIFCLGFSDGLLTFLVLSVLNPVSIGSSQQAFQSLHLIMPLGLSAHQGFLYVPKMMSKLLGTILPDQAQLIFS